MKVSITPDERAALFKRHSSIIATPSTIEDIGRGWLDIVSTMLDTLQPIMETLPHVCADCRRPEADHPVVASHPMGPLELALVPMRHDIRERWGRGGPEGGLICDRYRDSPPQIVQLKEKFGTLRVYVSTRDPNVLLAIEEATSLSKVVCEDCSAPAIARSVMGWWSTVCDACYYIRLAARNGGRMEVLPG